MKRAILFALFVLSFFTAPVWADNDSSQCLEPLPKGLEFAKDCQSIKTKLDFFRDFSPTSADGQVRAVITMPAGSVAKWKVDVETGKMKAECVPPPVPLGFPSPVPVQTEECQQPFTPVLVNYLGYVGSYGIVPMTMGVDGKPLEILVIGGSMLEETPIHVNKPMQREKDAKGGKPVPQERDDTVYRPLLRGTVAPVKMIGAVKVLENATGMESYKLLAVVPGTPLANSLNTLSDLDNGLTKGILPMLQTWLENFQGPDTQFVTGFSELGNPDDVLTPPTPGVPAAQPSAYAVLNAARLQ